MKTFHQYWSNKDFNVGSQHFTVDFKTWTKTWFPLLEKSKNTNQKHVQNLHIFQPDFIQSFQPEFTCMWVLRWFSSLDPTKTSVQNLQAFHKI